MDGLVLNLERSICIPEVFLTYLLRLHNYLIVQCCYAAKTWGECVIIGRKMFVLLGSCAGFERRVAIWPETAMSKAVSKGKRHVTL